MDWPSNCLVILPARNEGRQIRPLIEEIRAYLPRVLVVNDHSTDCTAEAALTAGAVVINNAHQPGKGAALRSGWAWAQKNRFAWCLCMDADGQHSPSDIPSFLAVANPATPGIIAGDRMHQSSRMPWARRQTNRVMSRVLSLAAGANLRDSQCGFRLICLEVLAKVRPSSSHFEIESEIILESVRLGFPIHWVEIQTIYSGGGSHIRIWSDTMRWLTWLVRALKSNPAGLQACSCEPSPSGKVGSKLPALGESD